MASSNATKGYADFWKSFADYRLPGIDLTGLFTIQRRNMEAFSAANQVMAESVQALSRRQAELLQSQVEEFLATSREILTSGSPEKGAAKQADFSKKLFEAQLSSVRELAEMASKSNVEALDIINKRVVKSMEDINGLLKKAA